MKSSKGINSIEALPKVVAYMNEMVKKGGALEANAATLAFHQNRFHNSWLELFTLFKINGFESGQAKIFKAMTNEMELSTEQSKKLGKIWDEEITPAIAYAVKKMGQFTRFAIDNPGQTAGAGLLLASILGGKKAVGAGIGVAKRASMAGIGLAGGVVAEDLITSILNPDAKTALNTLASNSAIMADILKDIRSGVNSIAGFFNKDFNFSIDKTNPFSILSSKENFKSYTGMLEENYNRAKLLNPNSWAITNYHRADVATTQAWKERFTYDSNYGYSDRYPSKQPEIYLPKDYNVTINVNGIDNPETLAETLKKRLYESIIPPSFMPATQ